MGLEVIGMYLFSIFPRFPELEPYHQMQFSVLHKAHVFVGSYLPSLCRGYSQRILSPADTAALSLRSEFDPHTIPY